MITQEVIDYAQAALAQGASRDQLRQTLLAQGGWTSDDIDEILIALDSQAGAGVVQQDAPVPATSQAPVTDQPGGVAATPSQTSVGPDASSESKGGGGIGKIIGIIAIVVLFITGTAAAGFYGYQYYQDSQVTAVGLIVKMTEASQGVTSGKMWGTAVASGNIDLPDNTTSSGTDGGRVYFKYDFGFDGWYDVLDMELPQFMGSTTVSFDGGMDGMNISFSADAEIIYDRDAVYIQLTDSTPFLIFDLSSYHDQWFVIDTTALEEELEIQTGSKISASEVDMESIVNQQQIMEAIESGFSELEMYELLERSFTLIGTEVIDGRELYHVQGSLSREDWELVLNSILAILAEVEIDTEAFEQSFDSDIGAVDMQAEIDMLLADLEASGYLDIALDIISTLQFDYWIDGETYLAYLSKLSMNTQDVAIEDIQMDLEYAVEVYQTNHNEKFEMYTPEETIDFLNLIQQWDAFFGEEGPDDNPTSSLDSIKAVVESRYGEAALYTSEPIVTTECQSVDPGDSFISDRMIAQVLSDVYYASPGLGDDLICAIQEDEFALAVRLNEVPAYYCVDSSGSDATTAPISVDNIDEDDGSCTDLME